MGFGESLPGVDGRGLTCSSRGSHFQANPFFPLKVPNNSKQVARLGVTGRAKHSHQTLRRMMCHLRQFVESNSGIDVIAENCFCFDPVFLQWIQDSMAGRMPHIDRIGIAYMYVGAWAHEADGFFLAGGEKKSGKGGEEFHVGPHLMIVSPRQDDFQGLNRDASNGMPYVTHLSGRTELFLVMPVRQWNEQ